MNCLICGLNPIKRVDFDGLCISCRHAVATDLYRIIWVFREDGTEHRVVRFATACGDPDGHLHQHPLGTPWPDWIDPIEYDPKKLGAYWREQDRLAALKKRIEEQGA